jgi:TolB protein
MKYLLILTLSLLSFGVHSLELTLSQGTVKPTPIAITNLYSTNSSLEKLGENISSVVSDNLERSGLFISIDKKAFIQSNESLLDQPRFEDWKILKTQHLFS